jgi:putative phosphoesterase
LSVLGPVTAVRGNVDLGWAGHLPETAELVLAGRRFLVVHNLKELGFDPRAAGFDAVISGHSHQPKVEWRDGVLHVNPGSAGARRFRLPIAVACIEASGDSIEARIVSLAE